MGQDYHIFRDLVMSERTYLKDLELMQSVSEVFVQWIYRHIVSFLLYFTFYPQWFHNDVAKEPSRCGEMLALLLAVSEPLIECHRSFLIDIEYLLYIW